MTNVVKDSIRIPAAIQRRAGIAAGDRVEIKATRGRITIVTTTEPLPKDEYTPAQRRALDLRLAEGLADVKAGRVHGPFTTHEQMMTFLKKESKPGTKTNPKNK